MAMSFYIYYQRIVNGRVGNEIHRLLMIRNGKSILIAYVHVGFKHPPKCLPVRPDSPYIYYWVDDEVQ